jgi:thymidylate synthase
MSPYDDALREILQYGVEKSSVRTGIKTLSIFGMLKRYRLDTERFPILTGRKVWPKSVFSELVWFLSGSTNNDDLKKLGCNFWTPWVDPEFEKQHNFVEGVFGPVYGFNLRHFGGKYNAGVHDEFGYGFSGVDQLKYVVDRVKTDTSCRRILWSLWNPKEIDRMRLPPCHLLFQILIDDERRMTGIMYQRSCDFPVGVPANIQFYSALTCMLAQQTDCTPFEFVHVTADSHIYWDQIDAVKEYLELPVIESPKLEIKKADDIYSYSPSDFVLTDFNPGPKIDIPVAV